jgi:hypothetical protein
LRVNSLIAPCVRLSKVVFTLMWATVLLLALMAAADPVRIGIAVYLISRPRPMLNLLVFWLGGMVTGVVAALGVLLFLRDPAAELVQYVLSATASGTFRHYQIACGVLAVLIAALIEVGFSARQRARVPVPVPAGGPSELALEPSQPGILTAIARLSGRTSDEPEGRLLLWVAFVAGLGSSTPPVYPVVVGAILASGAAIGTQLSAAVMFTVGAFAVVEIPLVMYLVAPAKTEAVVWELHNWLRARSRQIFTIGLGVTGVFLVATGV